MRNINFSWGAVLMLTIALVCNHVVSRIPIGVSKLLPIETFPHKIGGWVSSSDIPSSEDVKKILPHAHISERIYHKGDAAINFLLLTSPVPSEFHDPMVCLPAQGWVTKSSITKNIGGHSVTILKSEAKSRGLTTIYWYDGYMESVKPHGIFLKTMYKIRNSVLNREEGISLFVRIIYEDDNGATNIDDFLKGIQNPINDIVKSGT